MLDTKKLIKKLNIMINNIIFDFDGILVDSEILAGRAFSKYLKTKNLYLSEHEFSRIYSGNKLVEVISKLSLRFNIKDQNIFFNEVVALSNSIYSRELRPVNGVNFFLDSINQQKFIGSNRGKQSIIEGLKIANLQKYFHEKNIFSFEMVDRPKPDPDIYLKVIEDTKIEPSDTVILEDSIIGIHAAVAAKIKVIGVTSGGHWVGRSTCSLLDAGANAVASNFEEVLKVIQEL